MAVLSDAGFRRSEAAALTWGAVVMAVTRKSSGCRSPRSPGG